MIEKYINEPSFEIAEELIQKIIDKETIEIPGYIHKYLLKQAWPGLKNGNLDKHEFDDLKRYIFNAVINPVFNEFKKTKGYKNLSIT